MTLHPLRDQTVAHALTKPGAWLDHPWSPDHDVVKVGERIFMYSSQNADGMSVRGEPDDVRSWRGRYPDAIGPAPYMGTKPWNYVLFDGTVPKEALHQLVDESYVTVVSRLPKKHRPEGWDAGLA